MAYYDGRTSRSRRRRCRRTSTGHRRSGAAEPLGRLLADRADARAVPERRVGDGCRGSRTPTSRSPRTRRSCCSMSTPASARRSSPRSIRTRWIRSAALIIRPLARLHPKSHYAVAIRNTVKDADGGRCRCRRRSPRCATARLRPPAVEEADREVRRHVRRARRGRRRQDRARARVGLRDRVRRVPALGPDAHARRRDPRDGHERREPDVHRAPRSRRSPASPRATSARSSRPTSSSDGENDDSIMRRDADGAPMMQGLRDAHFAALIPAVRRDPADAAPDDHLRPRPVRLGAGLPQRQLRAVSSPRTTAS